MTLLFFKALAYVLGCLLAYVEISTPLSGLPLPRWANSLLIAALCLLWPITLTVYTLLGMWASYANKS